MFLVASRRLATRVSTAETFSTRRYVYRDKSSYRRVVIVFVDLSTLSAVRGRLALFKRKSMAATTFGAQMRPQVSRHDLRPVSCN